MSKQQLQEDINEIPKDTVVIQGVDLIKVLEAAQMLMEWPMPNDMTTTMENDWNDLKHLVDNL